MLPVFFQLFLNVMDTVLALQVLSCRVWGLTSFQLLRVYAMPGLWKTLYGHWTQESTLGFPNSSVGKESTGNAGDPGLIPESGKSAGEGIGYPLQYSWASLVAQMVKNSPAMWETWVQSLGWEDPLEKGKVTHSSILAWRFHGLVTKSWTWLNDFLFFLRHYFPRGSDGEASAYNAGDPGSIPGSGRSPGEGNGNPFQYSCLENPMDGGTW